MLTCPTCNGLNKENARFCRHCGVPIYDTGSVSTKLQLGTVLDGKYKIIDYVAKGGMGAIYKAVDLTRAGSIWAVKEMLDYFDNEKERDYAVRRFASEAEILYKLNHGSIPRFVDCFISENRYYLVMEFVEGVDMRKMLEEAQEMGKQGLDEWDVTNWAMQLCDVLHYLHTQDPPIIYRDLKPGNIIVTPVNRIFLIDFGIARLFDPRTKGTMVGTQGYAPPEQYRGKAEPRSDQYGLAACMHHLLTGKDPRNDVPFNFPPARSLRPDLSEKIERVLDKALKMDAGIRFINMMAFREALMSPVWPPKDTRTAMPMVGEVLDPEFETEEVPPQVPMAPAAYNQAMMEEPMVDEMIPSEFEEEKLLAEFERESIPSEYMAEEIPPYPAETIPPYKEEYTPNQFEQERNLAFSLEDNLDLDRELEELRKMEELDEVAAQPLEPISDIEPLEPLLPVEEFPKTFPQQDQGMVVAEPLPIMPEEETSPEVAVKPAKKKTKPKLPPDSFSAWYMYRSDRRHSGSSPYGEDLEGKIKWKFNVKARVRSSPILDKQCNLYFGADDSHLYCLDKEGRLKWKYQTRAMIKSSPSLDSKGNIYIGSNDSYLHTLTPEGKLRWKFRTYGRVRSSPCVDTDGVVYVGSYDHYLYAIKPNGKLKWRINLGGYLESTPAMDNGYLYLASKGAFNGNSYFYCLDKSGNVKWYTGIKSPIVSSPSIARDGSIFFGGMDGTLYALSPSGSLLWKFKSSGPIASSPVSNGNGSVVFGSHDSNIYCIKNNGSLKWKQSTLSSVGASPALTADASIIIGGDDYYVYSVNHDGSVRWKYKCENRVRSSPTIGPDDTLYVGSDDGHMYAFV